MSERILIPLDGSVLGEAALRHVEKMVAKLAPGQKIEVLLFHAISKLTHTVNLVGGAIVNIPYSDDELEKLRETAAGYLEKAGRTLSEGGASVKTKVTIGSDPSEEIIKAEESFDADLVAMSTHGRAGLSRWAFGSVTDKVLRGGKAPVLMVRASGK